MVPYYIFQLNSLQTYKTDPNLWTGFQYRRFDTPYFYIYMHKISPSITATRSQKSSMMMHGIGPCSLGWAGLGESRMSLDMDETLL